MLTGNDERVFLPVWRGGRILFFTNIVAPGSTRVGYFAAAASEPGGVALKRTGKAPINGDALSFCQKIADDGVALQKFFAAMGAGNLDDFVETMNAQALPYPKNTNKLIYTCLYLDFLRKYAVDTEIIRLYTETPVKKRFELDRSVGIYKMLSARLQPAQAEQLIDADLDQIKNPKGASMSVANLLRECAIVKFDMQNYTAAQALMLRAVELHDTEDKWRRLADFALAAGDRGKTVQYFLKAEETKPLPAPAALILGRILIEDGKFDQARPYVEASAKVFVKPAGLLLDRINAAQ